MSWLKHWIKATVSHWLPPETRKGVAVRFPSGMENGLAIMRALIERGVIGDFRAPDIMRFGFTPLTLSYEDIWNAVQILKDVMENGSWRTVRADRGQEVT